jgi:hypothetical protein
MKNKSTMLVVLALLGVSMALAGCPGHFRPHAPGLPHPLLPVDSMLQLELQNNAATVPGQRTKSATSRIA